MELVFQFFLRNCIKFNHNLLELNVSYHINQDMLVTIWFIKTKILSPQKDRANVFIFLYKKEKCPIGVAFLRLQLGTIKKFKFWSMNWEMQE